MKKLMMAAVAVLGVSSLALVTFNSQSAGVPVSDSVAASLRGGCGGASPIFCNDSPCPSNPLVILSQGGGQNKLDVVSGITCDAEIDECCDCYSITKCGS